MTFPAENQRPRRARNEPDTAGRGLPLAFTAPAAPSAPAAPTVAIRQSQEFLQPSQPMPDLPDDGPDDLFEKEWDAPRRTNRLTAVLVAGLVAVAGFAGGVLTQKNHDAGLTASAASGISALRNRAAAGGFGAASGYGAAAGPATGSGAAGAAASEIPVVVGTVASISGTTLKAKNFADAVITVVVPATATVTTTGLGGLTVGAPVSVVGTKAAGGTVTATSITSRKTTG
jgi:hypothetical protein